MSRGQGSFCQAGRKVGVGSGLLTACPQSQASGAATEEIVQGVVGLLADLGADAGGEAKHGPDSSCSERVLSDLSHSFKEGARRIEYDSVGSGGQASDAGNTGGGVGFAVAIGAIGDIPVLMKNLRRHEGGAVQF